MKDSEDKWIQDQRENAEDYLRVQQVQHLGVGEYPAFHVYPYLALWAVRSLRFPGRVGWWVITGDLPSDYVSSDEGRHPREVLRAFALHWQELSSFMLRGEEHPDVRIGTPDQWPMLGDLLSRRARILQRYADDEEIWTDDLA